MRMQLLQFLQLLDGQAHHFVVQLFRITKMFPKQTVDLSLG